MVHPQYLSSPAHPESLSHSTESSKGFVEIFPEDQLALKIKFLKNSFHQKAQTYLLSNFPILSSLSSAMAQAMRLHTFLQTKTSHFYQIADMVKIESWEKLMKEEAELEGEFKIASIWTSLKSFDSIFQEIITDVEAEMRNQGVCQEMDTEVEQTTEEESAQLEEFDELESTQQEGDETRTTAKDAKKDQAGPSKIAFQLDLRN